MTLMTTEKPTDEIAPSGGICAYHYPSGAADCAGCASTPPRSWPYWIGDRVMYNNAPYVIIRSHVAVAGDFYELAPGDDPTALVADADRRWVRVAHVSAR
ncbi:hypothetical protein ABT294_00715 [Nonomuraea sp. NPDC000554]|uniref:hypothetical protein n=1 Tax=Nonomuraea sp. NPDC000554 TaxID=3154259 RepID=UPI0033286FB0